MRLRRRVALSIAAVGLLAFSACGTSAAPPAAPTSTAAVSGFPLQITNCGQAETFDAPPVRAVTLDQIATESMLQLGLEGSMVGTAYRTGDIFAGAGEFPGLVAAYAKVPVLAEQYPSQEVLLNAKPDLVVGNSDSYTFGPVTEGGTGFTRSDLAAVNIKSYTFLCSGETATNDLLLSRFEEFARIFGKGDEAKALDDKIRATLTSTATTLAGASPVKTFWYVSGTGPLGSYGGGGQFANGLAQSGGVGVFDDLPGYPTPQVSAEEVVARNPDAIIIVKEGTGPDDREAKKVFLVSTLGPAVNAVRNDRFCYMDFAAFTTGPRIATSVTDLAGCLHPELSFG